LPNQSQSNEEFEKFLDALNKALPVFAEGTAEIAANQLRTKIQVRIFEGGLDAAEANIGTYSTKAGYFPLKYKTKSAGSGRNKKGETKRADGTAYKSQYLAGGYAEFRQKLGRQNQKVDFDITGELKQSITQVRTTQGENLIFNQEKFSEIAEGLEKRFKGKGDSIFIPSNKEAETVLDFIEEQFNELINELAARYNFKV
jgi:hypothetical protein